MNPWIKCKDELPPAEQHVLCFSAKARNCFVGYHKETKFKGHDKVYFRIVPSSAGNGKLVTHWTELPPDPREV